MGSREPREIRIVEDRWSTFRHIIEAIAIVTAGLWAFYTFVYQERIKPANLPASLDANISVRRLGRDAVREILSVSVVLHNSGKTEIDVAADAYNVWGLRYGTHDVVSRREGSGRNVYKADIPIVSRRVVSAFAELRDAAIGGVAGNHIILEPDATQLIDNIVVLRRGAYDAVQAQVIAVPIKTSETAKARVDVIRDPTGYYILHPGADTDLAEDDNDSEFALTP